MDKKGHKELLIIMPAYNEEKNIGKVLEQLERAGVCEYADVLVMNDASSDATNWLVKARGYTLVTHVFNLGYGSALQLGYKYAIRRKYHYVIQMDADGRCPDIVLGSRFLKESEAYPTSHKKKIAYRLFRWMIRVIAGKKISDPTTGLQGLNRKAVLYYSKYKHFDDKYPDANMIVQMLLLGFKIEEVPAVMHPRNNGVSMHHGLKPIMYMFRMVFSILAVTFRIKVLKVDAGAGMQDVFEKE